MHTGLCDDARMDWDDLRVFLAVARAGRFAAAARQLGVEHTTVSRRVTAFEANLGVAVFYRTAAGIQLTPDGKRVLASAEAMERAALAVGPRARERSKAITGRVRIAVLDEIATAWLAPRLGELRERHPALEIQLRVGATPLDLTRGEAELAIRTPRPRQRGLAAVRLFASRSGLYASRELLGGRRLSVETADDLGDRPLLVYPPEHHALMSAAWFQPILATARVALISNSTFALAAAARASLGVAVLPRYTAAQHDDLVSVSADLCRHDMWLVTHPEFRRDPRVREVAAFLRALPADELR